MKRSGIPSVVADRGLPIPPGPTVDLAFTFGAPFPDVPTGASVPG